METILGDKAGYVYVMASPNSEFVKVGGTAFPPTKRLKELNSSLPYATMGPWRLEDFRQVADWRHVEGHLHYVFAAQRQFDESGARELFRITAQAASQRLVALDPEQILKRPTIDRMFQDPPFAAYLLQLFRVSGLMHYLDLQGAWTFSIFTGTDGGRYFTLNIGGHEVAYSNLPRGSPHKSVHALVVDNLVGDFPATVQWVKNKGGDIVPAHYKRALPRSVIVHINGDFSDAEEMLRLAGVRRALLAYWADALLVLSDRGVGSAFAASHNWNAVAELRRRLLNLNDLSASEATVLNPPPATSASGAARTAPSR